MPAVHILFNGDMATKWQSHEDRLCFFVTSWLTCYWQALLLFLLLTFGSKNDHHPFAFQLG